MKNSDIPQRRSGESSRTTGRYSRPTQSERRRRTRRRPAACPEDRQEEFLRFARSVSCLLADKKDPSPSDQDALIDLVRRSFPEYLAAKRSLTDAQRHQRRQVRDLGPRLLGNAGFIAGAAESPGADAVTNGAIDEAARIMWEMAQIDEQIEALSRKINFLQGQIITWIRRETPASARAVRRALARV